MAFSVPKTGLAFRRWCRTLLWTVLLLLATLGAGALGQSSGNKPFWPAIQAFLKIDKTQGVTPCRTLFVGSSSIRYWTSLKSDLPELQVIRRGFGGAHLTHVVRYFDQLIKPQQPKEIILYAGENDIAAGRKAIGVLAALKKFLDAKTNSLGTTPVFFLAIKPSIYHWDKFKRQSRANEMIKALAEERSDLVFIDIVPLMLDKGRPKKIFRRDRLHMNRDGYALWSMAVRHALQQANLPTAPHCKT